MTGTDLGTPPALPVGRVVRGLITLSLVGLVVVLALAFRRDPQDIRTGTVGHAAPAFDLERLDAPGRVRLADMSGKVVVVNFFASWCIPCKEEAPALVRVWERYRGSGVVFVGIVYQDTPDAARAFHERMGQTWPIGADEGGRAAIGFGVFGVPETYFIGTDGVIAGRRIGAIDEQTLINGIEKLRPKGAATAAPPTPTVPISAAAATAPAPAVSSRPTASPGAVTLREFPVPAGSGPHDVAPAADGGVWFTAQRSGQLGWLDPKTGQTRMISLGPGSAPHGVIVDELGVAWITDGGQNAIVSVDPSANDKVTVYKLPGPNVDLNTAAIDRSTNTLWFTGQRGYYGRLLLGARSDQPSVPQVVLAPRGAGPYGITVTSRYEVYYASLAGDHIARVFYIPSETNTPPTAFDAGPIDAPTRGAGPRRVWSDALGKVWVSEWNAGQVARYDPATDQWKEWKLPGSRPQAYAVFVDDRDVVWLTDWGASAIVRFDPATERFDAFPHAAGGGVRQLHGRPGEVWGALSALDKLLLVVTR